MKKTKTSKIGFVAGTALLGLLAGCVSHMDGPRAEADASPQSVYVEADVAAQDDYVYYPAIRFITAANGINMCIRTGVSGCRAPRPARCRKCAAVLAVRERQFPRLPGQPSRPDRETVPQTVGSGEVGSQG